MYMCLTWKIKNKSLLLTCKVSKLVWSVRLYDALNRELGHCLSPIPISQCYTMSNSISIRQNKKTNETIFNVTEPLDHHLNGNWTCKHGTFFDSVTTEVTLLNFNHQGNAI